MSATKHINLFSGQEFPPRGKLREIRLSHCSQLQTLLFNRLLSTKGKVGLILGRHQKGLLWHGRVCSSNLQSRSGRCCLLHVFPGSLPFFESSSNVQSNSQAHINEQLRKVDTDREKQSKD